MSSVLQAISARLVKNSKTSKTRIKHRQLADTVLELIEEGVIQPGELLPTETVLTNELPFSLGTIQKAMRNLSELGVINRKTGTGTVVVERSEEIFDLWQFRFVAEGSDAVLPVFSKVTDIGKTNQKGPWSRFLGDEDHYVRIAREITVDHRFKLMNFFFLSHHQFGSITDLGASTLEGVHLHAVIRQRYGMATVHTKNRVACAAFPDPICLRLDLPSAARGIVCDILGFSEQEQPLSFQQIYVPAHADPMEFRELRPI